MITQNSPTILIPEAGSFVSFSDITRSEYLEKNSDPLSASNETNFYFPRPNSILFRPLSEDINYKNFYRLFRDIKLTLLLEVKQIQYWQEKFYSYNTFYSLSFVALEAVEYIKSLLGMSEIKVADLVDISRNTVRNWRNGQGAYPATVRKLFQVKHLISALHTTMKREKLNIWLYEPDDYDPSISRLERLGQPDGVVFLTKQANHLLFPPRPGKIPPQEMLVLESDLAMEEPGYAPNFYKTRTRLDDIKETKL